MQKQLRLDAMNTGRVLQGLRDMVQQTLAQIGLSLERSKHVSHHAFAALIDEEGVAQHLAIVDRRVSRQDLGIQVAENHLS